MTQGGANNSAANPLPPFCIKEWAALAYVYGRYNPPSKQGGAQDSRDILGIYISRADPGFSLWTFNRAGEYRAFHRCGALEEGAGCALIDGWLQYEIPIEQWYLYPVDVLAIKKLRALSLQSDHEHARKAIASKLHIARRQIDGRRPKLEPMFLIQSRSAETLINDSATDREIRRAWGLRDKHDAANG